MKFDLTERKRALQGFSLGFARELCFDEAAAANALASYGSSFLNTSVNCFLVGLYGDGRELLAKAHQFLSAAIERKEIPRLYAKGGTESFRHEDLALCNWLMTGKHDAANAKAAVDGREFFLDQQSRPDKTDVQLSLLTHLFAEDYERLIRRFEITGLKKPTRLNSIRQDGTMGYVIARQRLGLEYTAEEVDRALRAYLKRNMTYWLGYQGRSMAAARWMKIGFWKPGDDPIATLLKCYQFLPDPYASQFDATT